MQTRTIQHAAFFLLLAGVTVVFYDLVLPFLQPVFWAAVLAVMFRPWQTALTRRFGGRRSLAAAVSLLGIIVIVVLPLTLVGIAVGREAIHLYERIASGDIDVQGWISRALPVAQGYLDQYGVSLAELQARVAQGAVAVSRFVASQALAAGQDVLRIAALFFLMLYFLFFFLRDGGRIVSAIIRTLPLGDVREERLLGKFAEVSRATLKGTLVVGGVQGTLGGLLFWVLGIDGALFWGVIMTLLSLLPAVGAALVWLPAAIILLAQGAIGKGIVMLVAGTLVIGLVDNVLRPILVGRDTKMPDYLILLSTLGGLAVFGIAGFVLGPIVAALFLTVWQMFAEEYTMQEDNVEDVKEAMRDPSEIPTAEEADAEAQVD